MCVCVCVRERERERERESVCVFVGLGVCRVCFINTYRVNQVSLQRERLWLFSHGSGVTNLDLFT